MSQSRNEKGVIVPYDKVSPAALQGMLKEFVSRDGTDSGYTQLTHEQRVSQVKRQLERGEAVIVYDLAAKTANIVAKRDIGDTIHVPSEESPE